MIFRKLVKFKKTHLSLLPLLKSNVKLSHIQIFILIYGSHMSENKTFVVNVQTFI